MVEVTGTPWYKNECMAQPATFKPRHYLWLLMLSAVLAGGCSGINASKSVSPLDFLLPGLGGLHMRNDTIKPADPQNATNYLVCASDLIAPLPLE